jgi:hypothetical protein
MIFIDFSLVCDGNYVIDLRASLFYLQPFDLFSQLQLRGHFEEAEIWVGWGRKALQSGKVFDILYRKTCQILIFFHSC